MIAGRRAFDRLPGTTNASRGYARLVRVLRYALPAIAALMIGLVVAWPQLIGDGAGLIAPMGAPDQLDGADVMRMNNPRYVGRTSDAEPIGVSAASAYLDPAQPDRIHLERVAAEIARAGERGLQLLAGAGIYDRAAEDVDLSGGVELTTSDGYRFETPSVFLNLERGQALGSEPIAGAGPSGTIAAERFEFEDGGERLRFMGRVRVTLHPRSDVRS
jgi:lipopolysaccharide export system protein LptC